MANLWDVTDRDIDRFSDALLGRWLAPAPAPTEPAGAAPRGGGGSAGGSGAEDSRVDVGGSVAASRGACRLRHLIGAAPVCYGVPSAVVNHARPRSGAE